MGCCACARWPSRCPSTRPCRDCAQSPGWLARRATSSAASWPCCWGSQHHDLALLEAPQARPADPQCAGLVHVALRIGDDIETLRAFHAHLRSLGVALQQARDHQPSQSLSLRELDGPLVEVDVDADPT